MRIMLVAGARPNFMKVAPLSRMLDKERMDYLILNTHQHFSDSMSSAFIRELSINIPLVECQGEGNDLGRLYSATLQAIKEHKVGLVIVVGDVLSTLAAALAAKHAGVSLAHVEAGLRSFDMAMPEEVNRIAVDHISDFLFCSEEQGLFNLYAEGVARAKVHLVGNVMIDSLCHHMAHVKTTEASEDVIARRGAGGFAVVTLHRPSNVDERGKLWGMFGLLSCVAYEFNLPLIFPAHPRTLARMEEFGIRGPSAGIDVIAPLGYRDMLNLMEKAKFVLTDSGGVQEETTFLNTPCFTLRSNTERPATCECGTNRVVGDCCSAELIGIIRETLDKPPSAPRRPLFWDGKASERIISILKRGLS